MSGYARWGWLTVGANVVFVLANLVCIVFLDGGPLNWAALLICTASGIYCFRGWREILKDERRWTR